MPTDHEYYEPGSYTLAVPAGVTTMDVDVAGANPATPNYAERRRGRLAVSPGMLLSIVVGSADAAVAGRASSIARPTGVAVSAAGAGGGTGTSVGLTNTTTGTHPGIDGWVRITYDRAPLAPILQTPADGASVDVSQTVRFGIGHRDPDGDDQAAYRIQDRPQGASQPAQTFEATTPVGHRDRPPAELTAGPREWRAQTRSQVGPWGPWSGWRPYTGAVAPTDLTIVSPSHGAVVTANPTPLSWSAVDQDAYRARVTEPGATGRLTVYDSGVVEDAEARTHLVPVTEVAPDQRWQVEIRHDGQWSNPETVDVSANPVPPPTPDLVVVAGDPEAAITVHPRVPAPVGDQPAVAYLEVWRRTRIPARRPRQRAATIPAGSLVVPDGPTVVVADNGRLVTTPLEPAADPVPASYDEPSRRANFHPPTAAWEDHEVADDRHYQYQLAAVATTGHRSVSGWVDGDTVVPDGWLVTADDGRLVTTPTDLPARPTTVSGYDLTAGPDGALTTDDGS